MMHISDRAPKQILPSRTSPIRVAVFLIAIALLSGVMRSADAQLPAVAAIQSDPQVRQAMATTPLPKPTSTGLAHAEQNGQNALKKPADKRTSTQSVLSTMFALGLVLCLFLGVMLLLRRALPDASRRKLPKDVLEIIGTSEWYPKQQLVLMRFGNKLLLVNQQPGETRVISEVVDPKEVERMIALCEKPHLPGAAFPSFSFPSRRMSEPTAIG